MELIKIHIDRSQKGTITCPECGESKLADALHLNINRKIKIKCNCSHEYYVQFDRRQYIREEINLKGSCERLYPQRDFFGEVIIENISLNGLKIKSNLQNKLNEDDIVRLIFLLNKHNKLEVDVKGIVKHVNHSHVGVEFQDLNQENEKLIADHISQTQPLFYSNIGHKLQKQRQMDETLCINDAQEDLKRYLSSKGIEHGPLFSGQSWDNAVKKFRNYWETRYICTHCNTIVQIDAAATSRYKCQKCSDGRYTNSPNEIWALILKHKPQMERYFTVYDAFGSFNMNLLDFKTKYTHGFLVPIRNKVYDNSVITNIKNIYKEMSLLGIDIDKDNIITKPTKNNIRIVRKRNYSGKQEKISIGRASGNDIVLHNKGVSRKHAYLYIDYIDEKYFLIDNASSNGTLLNKARITPHKNYEIASNDQISFGPQAKVVYFSSQAFYQLINAIVEEPVAEK